MEMENAYMILARQLQQAIDNNDMLAIKDVSMLLDITHLSFVEEDLETGRKIAKPLEVYTAEHGSIEAMAYFLSEGGDINARDTYGNTPLMVAVNDQRMEMVAFLLKQPNIEILMKNHYGETVTSIAELNEDETVLDCLKKVDLAANQSEHNAHLI